MKNAVYALSADPLTFGHIDIIERAAKIFDTVYVAIGDNPAKKYLFNKDERMNLATTSLSYLQNVQVITFSGLLVDFAYENNIDVIIRGIRNSADMEYEANLYQVNISQNNNIETISLFTKPDLSKVSSSNTKAIQKENGNISDYVPLNIKDALEQRISGIKLFGVTGVIGSGKSYIANLLKEYSKDKDIKVHNLELDDIAKRILYFSTKPSHLKLRQQVYNYFNTEDLKEIASILFSDKKHLDFINQLIKKPLEIELRNIINSNQLKGIILINAAILVESYLMNFVNNNIILVNSDKKERLKRLEEKRNINSTEVDKRLQFVLTQDEKIQAIDKNIHYHNYGELFNVENNDIFNVEKLYNDLISRLNY